MSGGATVVSTAGSSGATATVTVLTAEVRTLVVGSRQVTLSVFKQLDYVPYRHIEPFGRVRVSKSDDDVDEGVDIVGRDRRTGALVRCWVADPDSSYYRTLRFSDEERLNRRIDYGTCLGMPLIVLAGLR